MKRERKFVVNPTTPEKLLNQAEKTIQVLTDSAEIDDIKDSLFEMYSSRMIEEDDKQRRITFSYHARLLYDTLDHAKTFKNIKGGCHE